MSDEESKTSVQPDSQRLTIIGLHQTQFFHLGRVQIQSKISSLICDRPKSLFELCHVQMTVRLPRQKVSSGRVTVVTNQTNSECHGRPDSQVYN